MAMTLIGTVIACYVGNKRILVFAKRLKGENMMAVALINPGAKRVRSVRGKTIRLVRAVVNESKATVKTTATAPEAPVQETVKMEFPYDDLYLMYSYITKEMGIKDPFNK
jgi:hypothetical protein